jgi:hypothetical protein
VFSGTIQFTEQLMTILYFLDITHTINTLHLTTWILLDIMLTDLLITTHFHLLTLMFQAIFQDLLTTITTYQNHTTHRSQDLILMITQVQDMKLITDIKVDWLIMIATI